MELVAASTGALETVAAPIRHRIATVIDADTVHADGGDPPAYLSESGNAGSIQVISFTSGSTDPSKGVLITTNQALDAACTYVHATQLTGADTLYTPFAFFHGMSTRLGVLPALIVGARVVVGERFSASRYWQEATECGATVGQTLPPMTALLKALPAGPFDNRHHVTRMYNSRADESRSSTCC